MLKLVSALTSLGLMLGAAHAANRSPYGGWTRLTGKQTGFFHVTRIDGRWWCFDPSGAAFFAIGTDHCNYNVHWCEALGYAPYAQNVRKKYDNDESAWAKSATDRLKQWNFNALGANNSPSTRGRGLAYMGFLGMGAEYAGKDPLVQRVHWTGFPNVFNPEFVKFCEDKAQALCAPAKDDPWLLGWFIDNELEWFGKGGGDVGLANEAIKRPAEHEGKKALVDLLRRKYTGIRELNAAWGTSLTSWDDALRSTAWNEHATEKVGADKVEFVRLCADRYFSVTTAAIRKIDPNHMVLGCRFAGNAPPVWDVAGKYCDIVTFNIYGQVDLENLEPIGLVETLTAWHKQAKRPMMVTEWSFPALDAGLPCQHGAGMRVRTQADKAKCFGVYQKTFFSLPFMVGSDYFMWVDEPALGISKTFPEDSNYGLVDVNDQPWKVFTETVARVNAKAYQIHSGRTADLRITGVEAVDADGGKEVRVNLSNVGEVDVKAPVVVRVDDRSTESAFSVQVEGYGYVQVEYPLRSGAHYVDAEADPEGLLDEVNRGDNRAVGFVYVPGGFVGRTGVPIGVWRTSPGKCVVSVPLSKAAGLLKKAVSPGQVRLLDAVGAALPADIFDLDGSGTVTAADEIAFEVENRPREPRTFFLEVDRTATTSPSRMVSPQKLPRIELNAGRIGVIKKTDTGTALDVVRLGNLEIGSFEMLFQQVSGGTWWDRPDKLEDMRLWDGAVLKRLEVTASKSPTDTVSGPFGYRATYAFTFRPDREWFTAQFLSLTNTDSRPWTLESYFYYPQSAIGGSSADDEVGLVGACGSAAWINRKLGAAYGIVAPSSSGVTVLFWKDEAGNQHADARKMTRKPLKPGQTFAETGVPVYLFCASKKDDPEPWRAIEQEIAGLPKWEMFR